MVMEECSICHKKFTTKSHLNRHLKQHSSASLTCCFCDKEFHHDHHLRNHLKQHQHPKIPLFGPGEARLSCSYAAKKVANQSKSQTLDQVWLNPNTAKKAAKQCGGDLWKLAVVITFGQYMGQTFKWLLENDVGWVVWLLTKFQINGEKNDLMRWQKECLLEVVSGFPAIMVKLNEKLSKEQASKKPTKTDSKEKDPPTVMVDEFEAAGSISDKELLSIAEDVLQESEVPVSTSLTTVDQLIDGVKKAGESRQTGQTAEQAYIVEGWQKSWESPSTAQYQGIPKQDIKWMKESDQYGLFEPPKLYKTSEGAMKYRKLYKDKISFNPPPVPTSLKGMVPNMWTFFVNPVFFWRPVGVMDTKIQCPNPNCSAPSNTDLVKFGYGGAARQVCATNSYYTLLTERLKCIFCEKKRRTAGVDANEDKQLQYTWLSSSPKILMSLAPAIRNMFPAILCGRRAIDKSVVTLLGDRLNSISMTKVQRLMQQGHDQWYVDRRGLYQTLLYSAHTAKGDQSSILAFMKKSGSYVPPLPQRALPDARVLRRAHLISEMEKMDTYRASILSVTGEILCIDGTRQILKKIYGDGQGTMQYLTSVLNEWGQFLTTIVVASESEGAYRRMAQGLMARFRRANAQPPKVLYTDTNCCNPGGTSVYESLFADWVEGGMVVRLDIRHWLHRWDTVVTKQTHAKYGVFMSALAGSILAYNSDDMKQLIKAVRAGSQDVYGNYSDKQMMSFLKPCQVRQYVRRITRGVEESACAIQHILEEFSGPAGLDIDGIPLFRSDAAVEDHWTISSKHLSCMQDAPGIQLYIVKKVILLNGVELKRYKCRRGSNVLEGLHAHLPNAVPSKRCAVMPFHVYLISFAHQWNLRMEALRVESGKGLHYSCLDPRDIQRLNRESEVLFGQEHLFEPNFIAPMPYPNTYTNAVEEELLGIEYAQWQSTDFSSRDYYVSKVEEEQSRDEEEEEEEEQSAEEEDEGVDVSEEFEDPVDSISVEYAVATDDERLSEEMSPILQDCLMESNLHLPGFQEAENLALALSELADSNTKNISVSIAQRQKITKAAAMLHPHDQTARKFVKEYE